MKKHVKSLTLLIALLLTVSFLPAAGAAGLEDVAAKALGIATNCAKQLDGAWGDQHAAMIASKEGADFAEYENMQAAVNGFLAGSGATYIYTLFPSGPVDSAPFIMTVDGSDDPDDYGKENEWEEGFAAAWNGTPTAGDEAWEDEEGGKGLLLSAYAPVHDSKGNVVAILGVDCPAK